MINHKETVLTHLSNDSMLIGVNLTESVPEDLSKYNIYFFDLNLKA